MKGTMLLPFPHTPIFGAALALIGVSIFAAPEGTGEFADQVSEGEPVRGSSVLAGSR